VFLSGVGGGWGRCPTQAQAAAGTGTAKRTSALLICVVFQKGCWVKSLVKRWTPFGKAARKLALKKKGDPRGKAAALLFSEKTRARASSRVEVIAILSEQRLDKSLRESPVWGWLHHYRKEGKSEG
jgi:hypothetical protein